MDFATFTKLWSQFDVKRASFSKVCPRADKAGLSSTGILSVALRTQGVPDKHTCQLLSIQGNLDKTYRITEALRIKALTRSVFWDQDRENTSI